MWIILPNPLFNGVSDEIIIWFVGYEIKSKKKRGYFLS